MDRWWHPDVLASRRDRLIARGRILGATRQFFADEGFTEVETQMLDDLSAIVRAARLTAARQQVRHAKALAQLLTSDT